MTGCVILKVDYHLERTVNSYKIIIKKNIAQKSLQLSWCTTGMSGNVLSDLRTLTQIL